MNLLIVTTLPHFLSIIPLFQYYLYKEIFWYNNVIITSTVLSILYHSYSYKFITFLDHLFSLIWFIYDIYNGYTISGVIFLKILIVNSVSFMFHQQIEKMGKESYYSLHSLWHLVNAAKCMYVSYLISYKTSFSSFSSSIR